MLSKLVFSLQTHNGNYSAKDLISDTTLKPTTSLDGVCYQEKRFNKVNKTSGYTVFVPFSQGKPAASYGYQIDWRPRYTGDKSPTAWRGWLQPSLPIYMKDSGLEQDTDRETLETLFEIAKYNLPTREELIEDSKNSKR